MKKIYWVLIAAASPFICPNESLALEESLQTDPERYGFFLSEGFLGSTNENAAGAGLSLGVTFDQQHNIRYTARYSIYFGVFSGLFSDKMGTLNEVSLFYGTKWKSLWLSAGLGNMSGDVYDDITEERSRVSTTGFAYDVLWGAFGEWADFELSGILSSEDSFTMLSGRLSF
jgi:hypothetical protein